MIHMGIGILQAKAFPIFVCTVIITMFISAFAGMAQSQPAIPSGTASIGYNVESYRPEVTQLAAQYQMSDYVSLILAVMQQESGGQGLDPMQSAEGPFNKLYPHEPNGITDPGYSIECGIQELKLDLQTAGCSSPLDTLHLELALQGYNFGTGYITWAKSQGGYSQANASAFSQMEAAKMAWKSYGDPDYVPHVLRYYKVL